MSFENQASLLADGLNQIVSQNAPIEVISDDILRDIFLRTLPTSTDISLSARVSFFGPNYPSMVLRRVSKRWKFVVDDHSLLWTSLRLDLCPLKRRSIVKVVSQSLPAWIEKAKLTPLQLHILNKSTEKGMLPLHVTLSTPDFGRITKLSLCGIHVRDVCKLPPDAFVTLEDLILRLISVGTLKDRPVVTAFSSCPHLQRVAIHSSTDTTVDLPWHQLSHLVVSMPSPSRFYDRSLHNCPDLVYGYFAFDDDSFEDPANPHRYQNSRKRYHWPSLSSLSMSFWEMGSTDMSMVYPYLFDRVDPINLRSLRLLAGGLDFNDWYWDIPGFTSFQSKLQSMESLEYLSLSFAVTDNYTYASILDCVPRVSTLDVELTDADDKDLLSVLIVTPSNHRLPRLKTVIIDIGTNTAWEGDPPIWQSPLHTDTLLAFIDSRRTCAPEMRLDRIIFYAFYAYQLDPGQPFLAGLEKYKREGLEVELRVVPNPRRRFDEDQAWVRRDPQLVGWPEMRCLFIEDKKVTS